MSGWCLAKPHWLDCRGWLGGVGELLATSQQDAFGGLCLAKPHWLAGRDWVCIFVYGYTYFMKWKLCG
jgi:hypothetical protein